MCGAQHWISSDVLQDLQHLDQAQNISIIGARHTSCVAFPTLSPDETDILPVGLLSQWAIDKSIERIGSIQKTQKTQNTQKTGDKDGAQWISNLENIWNNTILWPDKSTQKASKLLFYNIDRWVDRLPTFYKTSMLRSPNMALADEMSLKNGDILRIVECRSWDELHLVSNVAIGLNEEDVDDLAQALEKMFPHLNGWDSNAVARYCLFKKIDLAERIRNES